LIVAQWTNVICAFFANLATATAFFRIGKNAVAEIAC